MAKSKSTLASRQGDSFERDYLLRMGLVKPAAGVQPNSNICEHWEAAKRCAADASLHEVSSPHVVSSCALLARVASSQSTEDAEAALRWLDGMGLALALLGAVAAKELECLRGMGAVAPMVTKVDAIQSTPSRT
jgi:hypothetical protein